MEKKNLIPANEFCKYNEVETSFILWMANAGLISIVQDDDIYFQEQEMQKIERMMRLHYDLEINFAGLETIDHLLENIHTMQNEIRQLRNKLAGFSKEF